MEDWGAAKTRLGDVVEGKPYEGTYCVTNLRADIRAALERVEELEREAKLNRAAAEKHYAYGEAQKELAEAAEGRVEELEQSDPGLRLLFELQDSGAVTGPHSGLRGAVRELQARAEAAEAKLARCEKAITDLSVEVNDLGIWGALDMHQSGQFAKYLDLALAAAKRGE